MASIYFAVEKRSKYPSQPGNLQANADSSTGQIIGVSTDETDFDARFPGLTSNSLTGGDSTTKVGGRWKLEIDDATVADSVMYSTLIEPGWWWQQTNRDAFNRGRFVSSETPPRSNKEIVLKDIAQLQDVFNRGESTDFQTLISRSRVDTDLSTGHNWLDDMLHAWVKPWLRLYQVSLEIENRKTWTSANPSNYTAVKTAFLTQAVNPGLIGFWERAVKTNWRGFRTGLIVHQYNLADNRTGSQFNWPADVSNFFDQSEPYNTHDGTNWETHTVATWNAYHAINGISTD